jgi:sortase A
VATSTPSAAGALPAPEAAAAPRAGSKARRRLRRLGTILIVLGVVAIAYAAAIVFWKDPVTDLYNRWKQSQLTGELDRSFAAYRASLGEELAAPATATAAAGHVVTPTGGPEAPAVLPEQAMLAIERLARDYAATIEQGQPLGRIIVPRLGIDPVFVHGTRWGADLSRGPGHYERSSLPGLGEVTAIAGHRTTFGASFRHIDDLKPGDEIVLELAYGTFRYRVFTHEIVDNDDWSILDPRGFDMLVLSACHPLYSASQRWIVYARLVTVEPVSGQAFEVPKRT